MIPKLTLLRYLRDRKKGEDEEDSPVQDTVDKLSDSASPKAKSNTERSPPNSLPPNSPHSNSGGESPTPKLRLNTSLATDPALRSETMTVKTEIASPNSETNPVRGPSAAELEYLASLSPAFRALATAGHLFPPAPIPENDAINLPKNRSKQEGPTVLIENRTVPVFMCTPCGIRFSSASTLEAHQTYYCSHRIQAKGRDSDGDDPKSPTGGTEDGEPPNKTSRMGKQYACPHCSYSADKKVSLNRHMRMHSSSPAAPISLPVPVILPSSMHNGVEQPSPDSSQLVDRYCQDCDIRFSSVKTLKAHKMHYCSSRHAKGSPTSKNSSTPTSPAESQRLSPEPQRNSKSSNSQPFLLLRTNPILIVPYSLLQSASVFTGGASNLPSQDTACILLPNGTVQPMSNLVSHLANDKDLPRNPHLSEQVLKMREESPPTTKNTRKSEITPLDLSVRRPSESSDLVIDMEDEKENVFTSSPQHEDIVCAPSIPSMLGRSITPEKRSPEERKSESYSSTPSPNLPPSPNPKKSPRRTPNGISNIKIDGRGSKDAIKKLSDLEYQNQINFFIAEQSSRRNSVSGKSNPISLLPSPLPILLPGAPELLNQPSLFPLLNPELRIPGLVGGQAVTESPVGQVLIKQGVSKCQECNIVFCKHENYLAHKKHYCSARLPDLSSDESSRHSPGASKSPALVAKKESSIENTKNSQNQNPPSGKPPSLPYHQLICVACGIPFTSLDNLTTHQTYYCTKRSTDGNKSGDEKTRRCSKCKVMAGPEHQCVTATSNPTVTGWKCPCCDIVSPTAAAAQKHMDTHQSVKAFRCTICKYKGNTLRGMRTHIRMHFDKKNNDLQEEQYITCILDEDAEPPAPPTQQPPPPPPPPLIQPPHNNGVADSPRPSQVVVKVEVGTDEEFVDVDVIEPQSRVKDEAVNPSDDDDEKSINANNNVKNVNYCKSCDITFTYHSSLMAHKKFYCSAQSSENDCQSKSPRTTPETSVQ